MRIEYTLTWRDRREGLAFYRQHDLGGLDDDGDDGLDGAFDGLRALSAT